MDAALAQLLQLIANGIAIGAIYALVALGLVLTYKATEVLNFAHGDVLMASAFVGWALIAGAGWPFWLAIPMVLAFAAALGWAIDRQLLRRIAGQPQFAGVMLTIAIAFMIRGAVSMVFGPDSRRFEVPFQGRTQIGPLVINDLNLVILGVALLITVTLFWFLGRTRLGLAIQASSQNQLAAYLNGIRVKALSSLVWGGFGSVPGAILGGVLIGVIEQLAGVYLPDGSKDVAAYLVLIGVLVVWPRGLLGEAHGRRV